MNLRDWMRRSPKPATLRLDGKAVALTPGRNQWADAERTVHALGGSKLEALDAAGVVLRACTLDGAADDEEDAKPTRTNDGEAARLAVIAQAYKDAFMLGSAREQAFGEKLLQLATMAFERLSAIEVVWQQTLANRAAEIEARGEAADGDLTDKLFSGMIDGTLNVQKPNGKPPAPAPKGK